ncbi:protein of unknown function DUF400 [Dethiosulfovibrio peptidovorans DSM 11002]|uniref:Flagellar assembly protein T C-terminal domain-containing protein n=1 Tax=Dethiosulfovibrio peptidovorans DSM 11002 TaxID=469381 RepID=D2Z757_9BACT|nr:hypothetical protein [Dethiosulfovibrio peptidovorans]EFC91304.1 protein of unknown function DUF400 [Dethiosulfovibrio peptidovorans DSM 11002]
MRRSPKPFFAFLAAIVALAASFRSIEGSDLVDPLILWSEDRIAATGQGVAPDWVESPGRAKLLAQRAAILDLRRNLLEFVNGISIQSTTTIKDFMTYDEVRTSVEGTIKGVSIERGSWDGQIYTVVGHLPMKDLRGAVASKVPNLKNKEVPTYEGNGFNRLVLNFGDRPFKPSMILTVVSRSGKQVYGAPFMDKETFVERGAFSLEKGELSSRGISWGISPAWAAEGKPLVISDDISVAQDGTVTISDEAASVIEANGFDFRIPCNVTVISKVAAVRGNVINIRMARQVPTRQGDR